MTAFDVVVVPFPFTERAATKRRPALVISNGRFNADHGQVVLAMITSAVDTDWPSDTPIRDLKGAGLRAPSVVRLKVFTLDRRLVLRRIGRLGTKDKKAVRGTVESWLL